MNHYPIVDMHCDLTSYLVEIPQAHYAKAEAIGCASPHLQAGNVKLQVLAFYTATEKSSTKLAEQQLASLKSLVQTKDFFAINSAKDIRDSLSKEGTGVVMAIENASGLAEEDEPIAKAFERLDHFTTAAGRVAYIGFTHHHENRFGGGNKAQGIGLKEDGKALLEYMNGRKAALDLAHASDALAYGALEYIAQKNLHIPILASHSNFREVWDHPRNLPEDIAHEIIRRNGIIGINFLREYVHRNRPEALEDHIAHALAIGGEDAVVFGADYFYVLDFYDETRIPLYFKEHENAQSYPPLLKRLAARGISEEQLHKLSHQNATSFFERLWGE